ncbi:AraC family transcriptional regulator [uncultured Alcanivorax sp.]|jgi:AraC-like DNA-binding protein|uniref:AraC family transcriptional regulator n=1 Tax=uncultured Alcanivorax sp. TaxID=191215 RepID=UPI0025FF922E|nr:AraC family transcriptional regulator [uncultured Alcanivorax sp.]
MRKEAVSDPRGGACPSVSTPGRVRAEIIELYLRICEDFGHSREQTLAATGLRQRHVNPVDGWVSQSTVEALFHYRVGHPSHPVHGLRIMGLLDPANTGLLGYLCLSCLSVSDLFHSLKTFGPLVSNLFQPRSEHRPGKLLWQVDLGYQDPLLHQDSTEMVLGGMAILIQKMNPDALQQVSFRHDPLLINGEISSAYREVFHCPVYFGQSCSALELDPQSVQRKTFSGSSVVFRALTQQASRMLQRISAPDLVTRVKQEVDSLLGERTISREAVCERLGISYRNLHRKLKIRDTSYQQLLDEVRAERAVLALKDSHTSLEVIADGLAFSGAKSFSRWFVVQFGLSPCQFRERNQYGVESGR